MTADVLTFSALVMLLPAQAVVPPVEAAALAARRSIRSGHVAIRTDSWVEEGGPRRSLRLRQLVWFTGRQIRVDTFRPGYDSIPADHRTVNCLHCPSEGRYVRFTDVAPTKIGGVLVGNVGAVGEKDPQSKVVRQAVPNVRLIGFTAYPEPSNEVPLDSIVGATNRQEVRVTPGRWKDQDAQIVRYQAARIGNPVEVTIVPAWGHSVVRIVREFADGKRRVRDEVENDVAPVPGTDIWFPKHSLYTRTRDGQPSMRFDCEVEVKSFNQPIDPVVFQLAGMDAPNIPFHTGPGELLPQVWDGSKMVANSPQLKAGSPVPAQLPRPTPSWLIAASISTALVALAALVQLYRRRLARLQRS